MLYAESAGPVILDIAPQQCVWRAGDDTAWAAPSLDEIHWQPYSDWKPLPGQTHLWVRCHADLSALRGLKNPALQVRDYAAYELYLDGRKIGSSGNVRSGNLDLSSIRTFAFQDSLLASVPSTIAVRITRRNLTAIAIQVTHSLPTKPEMYAGDETILDALRARIVLAQSAPFTKIAISYGVIAVIAVMLGGLFFYDRGRREILLLSIVCLCLAAQRLNEFCIASLRDYSFTTSQWMFLAAHVIYHLALYSFFFALAGRRMPLIFKILIGAFLLDQFPSLLDLLLGIHQPAWLELFQSTVGLALSMALLAVLCITPFVAFWPYRRIAPRMRPLAALCMLWQVADLAWYMHTAASFGRLGLPNLFAHWGAGVLEVRGLMMAGLLVAMLGFLFREQHQISLDRAALAGEMQAASEIQHMLAPANIDTAPGLQIDVAYRPMRDVGGDFYLCRALPGGGQRVLLGDVSGKGAAAAMTATLLLGAAAARDSESPASLLCHMNRVLQENHLGGFATCICANVSSDGTVVLANAGHLPPYCRGEELKVDSGLPLGVISQVEYSEIELQLAAGSTVTFLSDGVVEARNGLGELFGFDRTHGISTQPADAIAGAAQVFGQEDDITVLTLTRLSSSDRKRDPGHPAFGERACPGG